MDLAGQGRDAEGQVTFCLPPGAHCDALRPVSWHQKAGVAWLEQQQDNLLGSLDDL